MKIADALALRADIPECARFLTSLCFNCSSRFWEGDAGRGSGALADWPAEPDVRGEVRQYGERSGDTAEGDDLPGSIGSLTHAYRKRIG
jgi:hypothetical protein